MANYIKPTFTLTANKNSVTSGNKGPLSLALALNASDLLSVDNVRSEIVKVPDTSGGGIAGTLLIDGSAYMGATGAAGTDGGFIYMKNVSAASATNKVFIGVQKAGGAVDLDDDAQDERFCTLFVGEFAWFPFDYTMDIYVDASTSGQLLEYWIFDRG